MGDHGGKRMMSGNIGRYFHIVSLADIHRYVCTSFSCLTGIKSQEAFFSVHIQVQSFFGLNFAATFRYHIFYCIPVLIRQRYLYFISRV